MQKKHLHMHLTILLLLILAGCGSSLKPPKNPYLTGVMRLNADLTATNGARLQRGDVEVGLGNSSSLIETSLSCDFPDGMNAAVWTAAKQRGTKNQSRDSLRFQRGLMSLIAVGADNEPILNLCLLPDNNGFTIYHAKCGESATVLNIVLDHISIRDPGSDYDGPGITPKWMEVEKGVWIWPDERYRNPCIGIAPPVLDLMKQSDSEGYIHLPIPEDKGLQIVFARSDNHDESIQIVRDHLGKKAGEVEKLVLEKVRDRFAFQINTEDDRANQAIAFLQARLIGVGRPLIISDPHQIAEIADQAVGLFLNSRVRPAIVLPGDDPQLDETLARMGEYDRIFWAANAVRAVLSYGILQDDKLTQFQSNVVSALSRLDAEYTADGRVILDPAVNDSLLRSAVSLIRYSDLMRLGQEISNQRGQTTPADYFRSKSMAASRKAQSDFEAYNRRYNTIRRLPAKPVQESGDERGEEIDPFELLEAESRGGSPEIPDTSVWVQTGARYGFNYLGNDPKKLMSRVGALNPFVWQRWLRYQFDNSPVLMETSDFDSLITLLLTGSAPGAVIDPEALPFDSDLLASAYALQNISEIYLGIHPEWASHRIEIEPRLPSGWGHTAARVPMGPGFLVVDYNFVKETATFRIEGIQSELDILFRYPLPSGKTLTAQFKLAAERPEVSTFITRDRGNLMHIEVE